jgi:small-conductance mechanosensitive channel
MTSLPLVIETFFQIHVEPFVRALLLIILGFFTARIISASVIKTIIKHLSPQQTMLLRRIVFYFIFIIFIASAIQQLGFHITALLGTAGILGVAIGIASQTSMSNIISGLFMIGEKPFQVGDYIKVNDTRGEVLSIDLLSIKLRTLDNTLVRIPNEILIKTAVTNLSFFPIRRADLKLGVSYQADLEDVKTVLFDLAKDNPVCLMEPKPVLQILDFGDSAINLQFSVWSSRENFIELKNSIQIDIKNIFAKKGINMPFPSRTLYTASETEPLSIKIIPST